MNNKLIILLALATMSFVTCTQKKDNQMQTNQNIDDLWQLKVDFNLPNLDPEAIQVGLVDFESGEKFNKNFDKTFLTEQLKKAKDEKEKTLLINSSIQVIWDKLFDVVKGSEVYLLTKDGLYLSLTASNFTKSKSKKWFISKVFFLDNKPYCYSVPLDIEKGAKLEITLDSSNVISLTDLYKKL